MRKLFIIMSCFFPLLSLAAETIIQGNIEGFNGKIIRAAVVEDYITNSRTYLAEFKIQENKYKLSFDIKETRELILKIEDKESSIFAEAGAVYNINLSFDEQKNLDKLYDKSLDLQFEYPKPKELNQLIKSFNTAYNDFIANNYQRFVTLQAKDAVDKFIEEHMNRKEYQQNSYAKNYVKYALANLKNIISIPEKKLYEEFLKDQEILYLQKEYMSFFKQLYQKSFENISIGKSGSAILKAIILDKDLNLALKVIEERKGIQNTALAELYLIHGLFEIYYRETIRKSDNINMLKFIAEKGSTKENRELASNIIQMFTQYEKGKIATNFKLLNEKGKVKTLKDFYGKPIYIGFWASWSIPSLKQLEVMNMLHKTYGDKINFISINLDEDSQNMKDFVAKNKYPWSFLHYGNDYKIRENYNVLTVPTYFILDENGRIIEANTQDPTEIEKKLYQLTR